MNKREFLRNFATVGIGTTLMSSLLSSCSKSIEFFQDFDINFNGNVLVIGAGAAGITAGHILHKKGIDFQILEASSIHGGRVKKANNFVDFPIDLGGEWIHTDPSILAKLINDKQSNASIDIINYNPQTISIWKNQKLRKRNFASYFYSEHKFKSTTWYDFFNEYMIPNIQDKITYNSPVTEINYTSKKIIVNTTNDDVYKADKILITVPIKILQNGFINFTPSLPKEKLEAINAEYMPDGIKVFIEFSQKFYPDILMFGNLLEAANNSEHTYYDAAFGKETDRNVFALFAVGEMATKYTSMGSDEAIFNKIMEELDTIFEGQASQYYIKHIIQNWSKEPFIQGSYSNGYGSPEALASPINDQIYFAGEATAPNGNTSTVHGAAESAYAAVEKMLMG